MRLKRIDAVRHCLFNTLCLVSLVAAVGAAALQIASVGWRHDSIVLVLPHRTVMIGSGFGAVQLAYVAPTTNPVGVRWTTAAPPNLEILWVPWLASASSYPSNTHFALLLPYWMLILVLGSLPTWWLVRRRRKRSLTDQYPRGDYDVRELSGAEPACPAGEEALPRGV